MKTLWFFEEVNLFSMLCPHKFKAYKQDHDFNTYKKQDYIYFEEDNILSLNQILRFQLRNIRFVFFDFDLNDFHILSIVSCI